MKRNIIIELLPTFIAAGFLSSCAIIFAQKPAPDSLLLKSDLYREKYHIFTDRNIYASGEKIFFRVFNLTDPELKEISWSTVLYVDLIDAGNKSYIQGKFKLDKSGASGYISVPSDIRTGNYYMRAYTKWMRNFSPYDYAYAVITLINPYSEETNDILNPDFKHDSTGDIKAGGIMVLNNAVKCSTSKELYEKREKVRLEIKIPAEEWVSSAGYCVTVIKSNGTDSNLQGVNLSGYKKNDDPAEIKFWPEIQGLSLSGSIIKKDLNVPSAYSEIHISAVGENPFYAGYLAQQQGRFLFSLPDWHETRNFFIGVETKDQDPVEILIDNDFSADLVDLPAIPFMLSAEKKDIAREIMFNMQLQKAYELRPDSQTVDATSARQPLFFYGEPEITLKPDDYVKLPTLEEFFIELIPQASIVKRKEGTSIVMKGYNPDISFFKPLILLDFVPVFNADNLLKLSPELISRIEIINSTYVRGNMCFGGIISVFSKKGDMAGIELPENSYFFDFKTYEARDEIKFPAYSGSRGNARIPDFRNTMYWNPSLNGNPSENVSCEFYTSDNPGEYTVTIRGISEEGSIIEGHCNFTVK